MLFLIIALIAYLVGSIPFGLLIAKVAGQGDIRAIGSGNIGATNVLRTGRKDLAALTLLGDGLKGVLAVFIANWMTAGDLQLMTVAALFAVVGHCFPVWLRFKGGKGVATAMGVSFALSLWLGLIAAVVWLFVAALFRISSLAALVSMVAVGLAAIFMAPFHRQLLVLLFIWAYVLLILAKHHQNIGRLLKGQEPKIGAGK